MAKKNSQPFQVLATRTSFRGPVFHVTSDQIVEPGGTPPVRRDTVCHPGSVAILALDEAEAEAGTGKEPRLLLARQFRYPVRGSLWELPAGKLDGGESELTAARRELLEETGCTARRWKRALFFYPSPGFLNETITIYLARDLVHGAAQPEEDERISTRFFPLSTLLQKAASGKLRDGKTIAGVLWLAQAGWLKNDKKDKKEKTQNAKAKNQHPAKRKL